jgi:hypothetical protein
VRGSRGGCVGTFPRIGERGPAEDDGGKKCEGKRSNTCKLTELVQ